MLPKLLLHVCCAPCSIAILDEIRSAYDLAVFFYNPNIHPRAEYEKRKREVVRVCVGWGLPIIDEDSGAELWETTVAPIIQDKEGGGRCAACYRLRLDRAAAYAAANGFDLYGTSLTLGRKKKSVVINAIGAAIGKQRGVRFLDEDWKKKGRLEKALRLIAERGIYRQAYCGCRFSLEETLKRAEAKQLAAA